MKICGFCNEDKPLESFGNVTAAADGKNPYCKPCTSERDRGKRDANLQEDPNFYKRRNLLVRYNISLEQYEEMWRKQKGLCASCKQPQRPGVDLYVDHDHSCCGDGQRTCGKCIRGLLCDHCNRGLGYFLDSQERLQAAIDYLKEYSNGNG